MHRLGLALIATATLIVPAMAQSAKPSPKVEFGKVPPGSVMSGDVIGLNAVNGAKQDVGKIQDIVIDHSRLAGYVLSVGGFLGMGERYVEVRPASVAITYDDTAKKWNAVVNASKDELKAAPEFKYDDRLKH